MKPRLDLLETLIEFCEKGLGHKEFDFSRYTSLFDANKDVCGTAGCLAGDMVLLGQVDDDFSGWYFKSGNSDYSDMIHKTCGDVDDDAIEKFFNLPQEIVEHLFIIACQLRGELLGTSSTKSQVLANAKQTLQVLKEWEKQDIEPDMVDYLKLNW